MAGYTGLNVGREVPKEFVDEQTIVVDPPTWWESNGLMVWKITIAVLVIAAVAVLDGIEAFSFVDIF